MAAPHLLIVEARFYDGLADALLDGAKTALNAAGATYEVVTVPGALEIPGAIALAAQTGRYAGYVALGAVIRGETYHFEVVCNESARGILDLTVRERLAIGNGILTCDTERQTWERANKGRLDKGGGAAKAALAMIALKERFQ
jgi:6,7-dimethyl-8-ribityllumazine synthase